MKAAVVRGNCDVAILDVPEPSIEKPTEIKIRVIAGAICNTTDNKVYATDHPEDYWPNHSFPFIIGHEATGRIIAMGGEVRGLHIGDRVVFWTVNGKAFADYLIIDTAASAVAAIGDSVSNDAAAMMEMAIGSARLLFEAGGTPLIREGDAVVIYGLGPAGLIYHRLARMMGAGKIIGVGRRELRLRKSLEAGADHAVSSDQPRYIEEIIALLGKRPDAIVDATGGDIVADMISLCKPETIVVPYGVPPFNWADRLDAFVRAGLKPPAFMGLDSAHAAIRKCVEWAESGKFGLERVISHKLPLSDVGRGLDMCRVERDTTLKVIISINE